MESLADSFLIWATVVFTLCGATVVLFMAIFGDYPDDDPKD